MSGQTVRAIENEEEWKQIITVLNGNHRDFLLFQMVVRLGIPVQHLLQLRNKELKGKKTGDRLTISIPGTLQTYDIILPEVIYRAYRQYVDITGASDEEFLFKSRKGDKPLTIQSASRLVKKWFSRAGLEGFGGIMSLHKTWERHFSNLPQDTSFSKDYSSGKNKGHFLPEIKVQSVQNSVYTHLLRAIVSARIRPGEKIIAEQIARQMKVSRIPVREALGRLETKNLVYTIRNKGIFASSLSVETMRELIDIRSLNEKKAAGEAALIRTNGSIAILESLHEKYKAAWNTSKLNDPLFDLNRHFHFAIYQQAAKPILLDVISFLWDRFSPYLYVLIDQTDILSHQEDIAFHQGMIDGMKSRDPSIVVKWLMEDINGTHRILEKYFSLHKNR